MFDLMFDWTCRVDGIVLALHRLAECLDVLGVRPEEVVPEEHRLLHFFTTLLQQLSHDTVWD